MRARGINYDTGTFPGDRLTRKAYDQADVRRDMRVIAGTTCTATPCASPGTTPSG